MDEGLDGRSRVRAEGLVKNAICCAGWRAHRDSNGADAVRFATRYVRDIRGDGDVVAGGSSRG
jgi:hypothetical protein